MTTNIRSPNANSQGHLMTTTQASLTIIGDISFDLVLGPIDKWPEIGTETLTQQHQFRAGGSAANAALAMSYLGQRCKLLGAVGDDYFGTWLNKQLSRVDTQLLKLNAATSSSVGITHTNSERTFFTTTGHLNKLSHEHILPRLPYAQHPQDTVLLCGAFLTTTLNKTYTQLIQELKSRGFRVAIDIGWPPSGWTNELRAEVFSWLKLCHHILLSKTEITELMQEQDALLALDALQKTLSHQPLIVVKSGELGAYAAHANGITHCPAHHLSKIYDTVGAGDSFNAGYLLSQLRQCALTSSLSLGCSVAAAVISTKQRDELDLSHLFSGVNTITFPHPPNSVARDDPPYKTPLKTS